MDPIGNRIANYMYASDDHLARRRSGGSEYIIGIASAYNAFGLIGPEANGIFVLNDTFSVVVTDQVFCADTGWFGPTAAQIAEFERVLYLSDAEFLDWCRSTPRYRGVGA